MTLKIMKKTISILCAVAISASSMGTSVSAIKAYTGIYTSAAAQVNLNNAVDKLNNTLKTFANAINESTNNVSKLTDNQENEEMITRLAAIISKLESIKNYVEQWNNLSVEDIEFVNEIQQKIDKFNLNSLLNESTDINKLNLLEQNVNKIFNDIKEVDKNLKEESEQLLRRPQIIRLNNNKKLDNKDDNLEEFNKTFKEYSVKCSEFIKWRDSEDIDPEEDITKATRINIFNLSSQLKKNFDAKKAKEYISIAKNSIEEMESFKNKIINEQKNNEKFDNELIQEINQINNSDEEIAQKTEKIINTLENKKFNNYNKQLNTILPIIDSLHIAGDNVNIEENKNLRNKFKKFLIQSIEQKIDKEIKLYNKEKITKPLAEHINLLKTVIAEESVNVIITATFHGKYINADQLFDVVNSNLSSYEEDFKNSDNHDKNLIKDIDKTSFVKLLDNIANKNHNFDSKQESEKFDIMFRQYAKRITGMKTNLELVAGYGKNDGEDIQDNDLITDLEEAINKWGVDHLEEHYIRDVVIKDNLNDVLEKYKSLNNLKEKIQEAMTARVNKDFGLGDEEELKVAKNDARKALDDFQKNIMVTNNNKFMINEN